MRFFSRLGKAAVIFAICMVLPGHVFAAPQEVTVSQGFDNILSQGVIFANICSHAAPEDGVGDDCACRAQGICSLAEVTQVGVNIIILILGISGTVALLMFVYGGWNWVFAQGRPEFIQTGKDTMKHAMIGLAIVFGAYAIVNFIIAIIGGISPDATIEGTIEDLQVSEHGDDGFINADDVIQTTR